MAQLSPYIHKLESEIAALSFEEKLWLLAQIAQQVQPVLAEQFSAEVNADLRVINDASKDDTSNELATPLEGNLLRKDGVLVLVGTVEGDVDSILDEVREERIQKLLGS